MRQFIRHPVSLPIEYTFDDNIMHSKEFMKNIGERGLCISVSDNIEPGSVISIHIPVCTPAFEAKGIVVWCCKTNGKYELGVKFADAATEFMVRMIEQVCHIKQYKKEILEKEGRTLSDEEAAAEWIEKYAKDFPE